MSDQEISEAEIHLGYYKQGDDLCHNIVKKANGDTDVIQSFKNHKQQLQHVVNHLEDIIQVISKYPNAKLDLNADTHYLSIYGDPKIIQELIDEELTAIWVEVEPVDETAKTMK